LEPGKKGGNNPGFLKKYILLACDSIDDIPFVFGNKRKSCFVPKAWKAG